MLVYIRAGMREKILQAPRLSEVPTDVSDFFDRENGVIDDMQRELDVHNECGVVYLISQEIIRDQFYHGDVGRGQVQLPPSLPTNTEFQGNAEMRVKVKVKMSATVQDLVAKIRQYTRQQVLIWRVTSRGPRAPNKLEYLNDGERGTSQNLFRPRREVEVFYVRAKGPKDGGAAGGEGGSTEGTGPASTSSVEPPHELTGEPDPERPIFVRVSPLETTQLQDNFAQKQRFVQDKDMGRVFGSIYEEKVNQIWRFSQLDLSQGEDPDDEQWYTSDEEQEEESQQDGYKTPSQYAKGSSRGPTTQASPT